MKGLNKHKIFIVFCFALAFIMLLALFTTQELQPITSARIEDCQGRVEKLKTELEKLGTNYDEYIEDLQEGYEDNNLTDDEKNLIEQIKKYEGRITMLQNREKCYGIAMILVALFLVVGYVYQKICKANFTVPLVALCVLLSIGLSFRVIISFEIFDVIILAISMVAMAIVFLVSRRILTMCDGMFYALMASVILLLVANLIFAKEINGAKNWIYIGPVSVQPSEIIKFLLIMMGAHSYISQRRVVAYYLTSLVSCMALLCFKDLGTAVVIFALMLMMTLLLLDNPKLFVTFLLVAVGALICAFIMLGYVRERFDNWGNAMETPGGQQAQLIRSIIFGGFGGLGIENSTHIINIYSIDSDVIIGGITSVFGFGMLLIVMLCYSALVLVPRKNVAVYPWAYYATTQFSVAIAIQALLNFLGSIDVLPFTGIVAPFLSNGGSSSVAFFMIFGLVLASLHPKIVPLNKDADAV